MGDQSSFSYVLDNSSTKQILPKSLQQFTTNSYHCKKSRVWEDPYMLLTGKGYFSSLGEGSILLSSFRNLYSVLLSQSGFKDKAKVLPFMLYLINQDLQLHFYNLIHLFGYRHLTEQLNPYFHVCSKVRLPAASGNCCRSLISRSSMSLTRQHNAEEHTETTPNPSNSSSLA